MYDYNNGRFLSVDPFIQAPTSTQSMNPYTYIFNNPLSGTDPSGYCSTSDTLSACTEGLKPGDSVNITDGDQVKGTVTIGENGQAAFTNGTGKTGQKFNSVALKNGNDSSGINGAGTAANANQGSGAIQSSDVGTRQGQQAKSTGVTAENANGEADLFNSDDKNGFFTNNEEILNNNPNLHGEVTELLGGRVQIAKWGSEDAIVSQAELSAIRASLNNLDSSDGGRTDGGLQFIGGKQLLGRLSKDNPLKILLNTSGVNSSQMNGIRLITIDIDSDVYFKDFNNGRKWIRFSLERKLAHEIGHATTGDGDENDYNVRRTDFIMGKINGTRRRFYSNASSWCLTCED